METASAYKALPAEDKKFLSGIAKDVAILVDKPKKREYFRKQLTVFADKWRVYKTAYQAGRKGKWQPSMGKPDNPLNMIWPRPARAGRFPIGGNVPGAYALLAVIHDKVLVRLPSIAKDIFNKGLSQKIWSILVTGRCQEDSIKGVYNSISCERRRVIPVDKIEGFLRDVKIDIDSHFAPKKSVIQKPPASGKAGDMNKPQEKDGRGKNDNDREIDSETKEQAWRDEAPEYMPNADAVRMADGKISASGLSKLVRKPGNIIRWMRNKKTRRSKVHTQDFRKYIKNLKSVDEFSEAVFRQRERQTEIDLHKRNTGK